MKAQSKLTVLVVLLLIVSVMALSACSAGDPAAEDELKTSTEADWAAGDPIFDIEAWRGLYPKQVETFASRENAAPVVDYLTQYPWLKNVYAGSGFAEAYESPRPHPDALEDVKNTPRTSEKTSPGCYSCKSPQYVVKEKANPEAIYAKSFVELKPEITYSIGCYDCHGNLPGRGRDGNSYLGSTREMFTSHFPDVGREDAACGQCHSEHYSDQKNPQALAIPEFTDPTRIYEYYESINLVDYVNPETGTGHLKAQHPEFQVAAVGNHVSRDVSCSDCHFEKVKDAGGNYTNHAPVSPSKSPKIREDVCLPCHSSMSDQDVLDMISGLQVYVNESCIVVGQRLAKFNDRFAAAIKAGKLSAAQVDELRALNREAQWYWDWVFSENGDGIHNPGQARDCLVRATALLDQAESKLP